MWSIDGIEIENRLGELTITVSNQEKYALVLSLLRLILVSKFEMRENSGDIWLLRGSFLYSHTESGGRQVYIPFNKGKDFYGLYINEDIFYFVGNASLDVLRQEYKILDRISELDS